MGVVEKKYIVLYAEKFELQGEEKHESIMIKVITYGTFDLFHEGHYRLLKRAKALGDYLIVGVTTEAYDKARGKLNVVDSLMIRIENVKKSGFADEIIEIHNPDTDSIVVNNQYFKDYY